MKFQDRLFWITTLGCTGLLVVYFALCAVAGAEEYNEDTVPSISAICIGANINLKRIYRHDEDPGPMKAASERLRWWYTFSLDWSGAIVTAAHAEEAAVSILDNLASNAMSLSDVKEVAVNCTAIRNDIIAATTEE